MRLSYYRRRTLCGVLEDMRMCSKTRNYAPLDSLIEEAQMLGDKMEYGLEYKRDIEELHEERKQLIEEVKKLKEQTGGTNGKGKEED